MPAKVAWHRHSRIFPLPEAASPAPPSRTSTGIVDQDGKHEEPPGTDGRESEPADDGEGKGNGRGASGHEDRQELEDAFLRLNDELLDLDDLVLASPPEAREPGRGARTRGEPEPSAPAAAEAGPGAPTGHEGEPDSLDEMTSGFAAGLQGLRAQLGEPPSTAPPPPRGMDLEPLEPAEPRPLSPPARRASPKPSTR